MSKFNKVAGFLRTAKANDSGLQKLMNHHYKEILRLKKGKDLSEYDKEHKSELIAFLDTEIGRFKKQLK